MAGCKFINSNKDELYLGWVSSSFLNDRNVFDDFEKNNDLVSDNELIVLDKGVLKMVSDKILIAIDSTPKLRQDLRSKMIALSNFLLSADTIEMVLV
jgi:hypothetical protein